MWAVRSLTPIVEYAHVGFRLTNREMQHYGVYLHGMVDDRRSGGMCYYYKYRNQPN